MPTFRDYFIEKKMKRGLPIQRRILILRILTYGAIASFFFVLLSFFFLLGVFAWYARDLPRPDKVKRLDGLSTIIYDRHGTTLYDIYKTEHRIPVKIDDVPEALRQATIAIEDKDFYKHQGLSLPGIARAMLGIILFRDYSWGGGSTLTQQLVKNVLLNNQRVLSRKIKEAILAIQIERKYSKDEILTMYFNEAPYGGPAVGVEAAAQYYFGKSVKDLTFLESVVLAGLPQSPSRYNPFTSQEKLWIGRAEQVLRRMREDGYITPQAEKDAKEKLPSLSFKKDDDTFKAPHFVLYVREKLISQFGAEMVENGGLRVTTTLDWNLQEKAESIVKEEVEKLKRLRVSNGAAVVLNPKTGEILAMVGSKDYHDASESGGFKFNVVTQALRQPGSTIKPIVYAAAFKKGYTPATVLMDVDTKYPSGDPKKPEYNPKNYDGKFRGPMSLRNALGNSINTIAVKVTALVGVKQSLQTAFDMGLTTLEPTQKNLSRFGLSIALGGGEVYLLDLATAFGVFATGGQRVDPVTILKVQDINGNVLYEYKPQTPRRVLSEDIAYLVSHILSDNNARRDVFGERSLLVIPNKTVAVKTGTTDDKRDNWTVGYTPSFVVGAWVGNNDNSPMHPSLSSGITGAAPIWNKIMTHLLKDKGDESFSKPDSIIEIDVDSFTGGLPIEGYPTRKEIFVKGTEPTRVSPIIQRVKVSIKDENKLANPVDIAKGEFREKLFYVFIEDDPVSTDGKNRWQEGIDAWIASQSDSKYKLPKETQSITDPLVILIKEPADNSRINSNTVRVKVEATGEK
ncbi:MAG: PBP1A family penicillin-binding protein, partial [Patescibacteria group bacterium]|nr:PBP1A family penicillin-binding protein [Patescibacteria group bacterium]